jgi:hypothetical protein
VVAAGAVQDRLASTRTRRRATSQLPQASIQAPDLKAAAVELERRTGPAETAEQVLMDLVAAAAVAALTQPGRELQVEALAGTHPLERTPLQTPEAAEAAEVTANSVALVDQVTHASLTGHRHSGVN